MSEVPKIQTGEQSDFEAGQELARVRILEALEELSTDQGLALMTEFITVRRGLGPEDDEPSISYREFTTNMQNQSETVRTGLLRLIRTLVEAIPVTDKPGDETNPTLIT